MMDQIAPNPIAESRMTEAGTDAIKSRYMTPTDIEVQDVFKRAAAWYSDDAAMADRMYRYISSHWVMPATPVLTNSGTDRGLNISCLTGDSPILTPDGFKPMDEIEIGDKVLTHKGRWRRVVAKKSRVADNLYNVKVDRRRTNVGITGNHPALAERGWTKIDELRFGKTAAQRDYIAINRYLEHSPAEVSINLAEHCPYPAEVREEMLVALSTKTSRFDKQTNNGVRGTCAMPMANVEFDEEIGWAVGLWLAEGSLGRSKNGTKNTLRITLGQHERDIAERWLEIITRRFSLNGKIKEVEIIRDGKPNRWLNVDVSSVALATWFEAEFGTDCKTKTFPGWMLGAPKKSLNQVLEGFKIGDGCNFEQSNCEYTLITIENPKLLGALYNITLILGIDATLRLDTKAGKLATVENVQTLKIHEKGFMSRGLKPGEGMSKIRRKEANSFASLVKHEKVPGEHLVWDIQVEEDESFTVAGWVVHNCFLQDIDDTMSSIIEAWTECAKLSAKGGGVGTSYNRLRAIGEPTRGGKTSGAVSFAKVEDSITLAVSQGDVRRGSAAAYMHIDHAEIEDFMMIRDPSGDINRRALNLHLGVCITDEFMNAVRDNKMHTLISRKTGLPVRQVRARELFEKIIDQRYKTGEPYIIFIDTVNRLRPLVQKKLNLMVSMSNLCSEITLPTGKDHLGAWRTAVCCLISLNAIYYNEWKNDNQFFDDVGRFVDNMLEDFIQRAPESFWRAIYSAFRERSVGIGLMGLHSHFQDLGIAFDSPVALSIHNNIFKTMRVNFDRVSRELAEERGPCPDAEDAGIMERFSNKMAIAPTASISGICGGASPCTEPVAANVYVHKTLEGSRTIKNARLEKLLETKGKNTKAVWDSINAEDESPAGSVQHLDCLTDDEKAVFKTANEVDQMAIIRMAAERSIYVDQASSTNLFIPANISLPQLLALHYRAWEMGVKTLYYLRSKSAQRAGNTTVRRSVTEDNTLKNPIITAAFNGDGDNLYQECEACQ
jgi:ribonucleoside-diphosphate reductase alpha chain